MNPDCAQRAGAPLLHFSGSWAILQDLLEKLGGEGIDTLLLADPRDDEAMRHLPRLAVLPRCTALLIDHGGGPLAANAGASSDLLLSVSSLGRQGQEAGLLVRRCGRSELLAGRDEADQLAAVLGLLAREMQTVPVWGCLLIGGRSSRMGRPKHLIVGEAGQSWAEMLCRRMSECTERIVLAGGGQVPRSLAHLPVVPDIAGASGPLAGIAAAMRWQPNVSWIVSACDMPLLSPEALHWLLRRRGPGIWGVVPRHPQTGRLEPLLAYYDRRCLLLFEEMLRRGNSRMRGIVDSGKIATPPLPTELLPCWRNCNTPEDLAGL